MQTLGFDWLKIHRGVLLIRSELKPHKGSKFMQGFKVFDWTNSTYLI